MRRVDGDRKRLLTGDDLRVAKGPPTSASDCGRRIRIGCAQSRMLSALKRRAFGSRQRAGNS
eukprot:6177524-Pleurochrysis_carterae.AAC.2